MGKKRGNGEGTIRKKGKKWQVLFTIGKGCDGRPIRKSVTCDTHKEALEALAELSELRKGGVNPSLADMKVSELMNRWLESCQNQEKNTLEGYERYADKHIKPRIGSLKVAELQEMHVEALLGDMKREGYSGRTRQQAFRILSMALKKASRSWKIVRFNVCENVTAPAADKSTPKTLTEEHQRQYHSELSDERLRALFILMAQTGLRVSEALGLCWDCVDLERGNITIRRRLTDAKGGYELKECGKTKSSVRKIKLSALAETALDDHRARMGQEGHKCSDQNFVFCRLDGEHLRRRYVWELHKRILERAGVPYATLKNLRHTAASTLLGRKHSLKTVADLLGHSTIKVTADTYSHVTEGIHSEAVADLSDAMSPVVPGLCQNTPNKEEKHLEALDAKVSSDED